MFSSDPLMRGKICMLSFIITSSREVTVCDVYLSFCDRNSSKSFERILINLDGHFQEMIIVQKTAY